MRWVLAVSACAQALLMAIDEFVFHRRRNLPRWERVGHPVDTLAYVACLLWLQIFPPNAITGVRYALLGVLSTLLVTKDEWVHSGRCGGTEHWLHALLFVLHPTVLAVNGYLWFQGDHRFFLLQTCAACAMGAYQLIYWNWIERREPAR